MDAELKKLYYNPQTGYSNSTKFYELIKSLDLDYTKKEINEFVKKQHINQVLKSVKRQKLYSTITVDNIRDEYQIDLIIYDRYEYHKYKYILVVVDIHSRYADARPLTNRENTTIMKNMIDMFEDMGYPKAISCDNEFDTLEFRRFCKEHHIKTILSDPNDTLKNAIVERLNRTLAGYIQKMRLGSKVYNWPLHLADIMTNYNNSYHRTIRNTPYSIFRKKGKNNQDIVIVPRSLNVGDSVRLLIKKNTFDKGDRETYSKEIYTIESVDHDKYLLSNGINYPARKLSKVNHDVQYDDIPDENDSEEKEHLKKKKVRKVQKILKQVGIDPNNELNQPRVRKPKVLFDI
jgi:hypothetical protein